MTAALSGNVGGINDELILIPRVQRVVLLSPVIGDEKVSSILAFVRRMRTTVAELNQCHQGSFVFQGQSLLRLGLT